MPSRCSALCILVALTPDFQQFSAVLWIRDAVPDPGSWIQQQPQKKRGEIFCPTFYFSDKYQKFVNIFEHVKKIFLAIAIRIIVPFTQKRLIKL